MGLNDERAFDREGISDKTQMAEMSLPGKAL